jgi:hypothetical protein
MCEEPLRRLRRHPAMPQIEGDVHRDIGAAQIVMMVVGGLLILGAVGFFAFGGMDLVVSSFDSAIAAVVILVLVILAGLTAIAIGSRNKIVYAVTSGIGGMLVGAAAVVIMLLLLLAALCSGIGPACKPMNPS